MVHQLETQCYGSGTCSDIAAEIAGSLAHAAIAFRDRKALAREYWRKAKMAYAQSGAVSGKFGASHEEYPVLATYYTSTGVRSHVFFAAASMYRACKVRRCPDEAKYLAHTQKLGIMKEADGGQKWFWEVPGWDNAWWDGALLMAQDGIEGPEIFGKPAYTQFLRSFVDKWTNGKSPIRYAIDIYKLRQAEGLEMTEGTTYNGLGWPTDALGSHNLDDWPIEWVKLWTEACTGQRCGRCCHAGCLPWASDLPLSGVATALRWAVRQSL